MDRGTTCRLDTIFAARFARAVGEISIARRIELIVLRPDASRAEIDALCSAARQIECLSVAACGSRVERIAALLEDSRVKTAGLVAFPFGASETDVKRLEIEAAIEAGAQEIRFVVNPGWIKDGNDGAILREMRDLRETAEERPVTAIVEAGFFTRDEMHRVAALACEAELQFIATATGCAARATTPEEIAALREAVGPELGITAVGGVITPDAAEALVAAGANRVGVFALAGFGSVSSGAAGGP